MFSIMYENGILVVKVYPLSQEEFEDTKGVIRIRQCNGQKNKCNRTNNDLQNINIKLKIE
jgi:hypothetical protein